MPRQARVAIAAQVYHVICRGNNRERVFADDEDFATYLDLCRRYKERDGFRLYHWVLMPNHVHLLLEPVASPLSRTMQGLQLAYTLWSHKKYRGVGHLWQDRFKSFVVERGWRKGASAATNSPRPSVGRRSSSAARAAVNQNCLVSY